jgi:hypothetical protein
MNRKKSNSICKVLGVLLVLLIAQRGFSQSIDTTIVRTVTPGKNDIVLIRQSGLNVKVVTWDKSELKIEYQLSVEADSKQELRSFLDGFGKAMDKLSANASSGKVNTTVQFREYTNNMTRLRLKLSNDDKTYYLDKLDGDIVIYMPKTNPLDVSSSFRKLEIGNLSSDATINISSTSFTMGDCKNLNLESNFSKNMKLGKVFSADMKINSGSVEMDGIETDLVLNASFSNIEIAAIGNKADIKLNSSSFKTGNLKSLELDGSFIRNFRAENIGKAEVNINSSNFDAKKIQTLNIDKISFSTLNINEIDELNLGSSSSSKFRIEKINSVKAGNCSFSDFKITNLTKLFTTSSNSGSINIDNISKGFEKVDIRGSFLTTNLHVAQGGDFVFSADLSFGHCDYGDLNVRKDIKDMGHQTISAWKGNEKASSEISLNCNSCRITVN